MLRYRATLCYRRYPQPFELTCLSKYGRVGEGIRIKYDGIRVLDHKYPFPFKRIILGPFIRGKIRRVLHKKRLK